MLLVIKSELTHKFGVGLNILRSVHGHNTLFKFTHPFFLCKRRKKKS